MTETNSQNGDYAELRMAQQAMEILVSEQSLTEMERAGYIRVVINNSDQLLARVAVVRIPKLSDSQYLKLIKRCLSQNLASTAFEAVRPLGRLCALKRAPSTPLSCARNWSRVG